MIKNTGDYANIQTDIIDELYTAFVNILDKTEDESMTGDEAAIVVSSELANLDTKLRLLYYEQCKYDMANGTDRTMLNRININ